MIPIAIPKNAASRLGPFAPRISPAIPATQPESASVAVSSVFPTGQTGIETSDARALAIANGPAALADLEIAISWVDLYGITGGLDLAERFFAIDLYAL
jgi:hypothetical protein